MLSRHLRTTDVLSEIHHQYDIKISSIILHQKSTIQKQIKIRSTTD